MKTSVKFHLFFHMGQDHRHDVLSDTNEKMTRDSQLFDPLHVRDLSLCFTWGPVMVMP